MLRYRIAKAQRLCGRPAEALEALEKALTFRGAKRDRQLRLVQRAWKKDEAAYVHDPDHASLRELLDMLPEDVGADNEAATLISARARRFIHRWAAIGRQRSANNSIANSVR